MSELRLSLLALGVGFILGLLAWEWWRRRQSAAAARRASTLTTTTVTSGAEMDDEVRFDDTRMDNIAHAATTDRDPVLGALPIVDVGSDLDTQMQAGVERYGLAQDDTVVLDPAEIDLAPAVRVDWPDEAQRRIIGLRVTAKSGLRFSGLRVRQALVGDGYVHGDFRIYHRGAHDGRAVLSAASLTKPGYFDLERMDTQTFAGLSLFAVLPGPLPATQALEMLLGSARSLAQRLGGEIADSSGTPLTDERIAELRGGVRDIAPLQRASGAV